MPFSAATLPGRLLIAFLLAAIGLQATPAKPLSQTLEHGPVYSAATYEVTLPPRREGAAEVRAAPVPLPMRPPLVLVLDRKLEPAVTAWPANRQTAPPSRPPQFSLPSPRGPPRSA